MRKEELEMKKKIFWGILLIMMALPATAPAAVGDIVAAINCGGPTFTASDGITYEKDKYFLSGLTYSTAAAIGGTTDDTLYQTERWGDFAYAIPVPAPGIYTVTLRMAEIYPYIYTGARKFAIEVEGKRVLSDFDLFTWAGKNNAIDLKIVTEVTDGTLNLVFFGEEYCCKERKVFYEHCCDCENHHHHRDGDFVTDSNDDCFKWAKIVPYASRCHTAKAKVNAILVREGKLSLTPVVAINSGGPDYLGSDGINYQGDLYFTTGQTYSTDAPIEGTDDDALYQTERFGQFSYVIPVANGTYWVLLKFAEIYPYIYTGARKIGVKIKGKEVLTGFDLYTQVGLNRAFDWLVPVPVVVTDGILKIDFHSMDVCLVKKADNHFVDNLSFNPHPQPCKHHSCKEVNVNQCRVGQAKVSAVVVFE
jgi:hypothetical protein